MRTIKAAVLYEYNTPMVIEEVQLDDPGPNEVLVKMAASGVCRSDLHVLKGEWKPPLPTVLGHEAAGRIEAVGPGVTRVKAGDPIVLSFKPNCGYCEYCMSGRPHLCTGFRGPAGTLPGGHTRLSKDGQPIHHFGSHVLIRRVRGDPREQRRRDRPGDIARTRGARWLLRHDGRGRGAEYRAGAARQHGRRDRLRRCGTERHPGARFANASRIIAVDISQEKLEFAERFGATDTIDAREENPVQAIRQLTGGGVDYAFEVLGSGETVRTAFDSIRAGGTAVAVGMAAVGEVRADRCLSARRDRRRRSRAASTVRRAPTWTCRSISRWRRRASSISTRWSPGTIRSKRSTKPTPRWTVARSVGA